MTTTLVNPAPESREYHWTADKFYQAASAGVFDDPGRLELIHGRIIEKMAQTPLHRGCRVRISRCLQAALGAAVEVVGECPIHIAFDGEPVPDIVVLRVEEAEDEARHPAPEDVVLLVEVAVSSEKSDQTGKALLYAQAGIADYWVALPEAGAIVVHRVPTPQGYGSVARLAATDTLAPLAASDAVLSVRDLLGLEATEEEKTP